MDVFEQYLRRFKTHKRAFKEYVEDNDPVLVTKTRAVMARNPSLDWGQAKKLVKAVHKKRYARRKRSYGRR